MAHAQGDSGGDAARVYVIVALIAAFGVAFTVLVYFVFLPLYGARASGLASFFALAAFGTIYLSRSLYGEVPALAFVLLGLLAWRQGLARERGALLLIAAGLCFGLAVLTKAFMAAAALAVVGAYVFDRVSHRRISPRGILLPAAGTLVIMGAWQAVEFAGRHLVAGDKPSLALYYRHSLSFGLGPVWENVGLVATVVPVLVLGVFAVGMAVPRVFRDHYDPALVVLFLLAPLTVFWFAFFTPMHLPRYLWYPAVIAAMFSGPLADRMMSAGRIAPAINPRVFTPARVAVAGLLAWVYLAPGVETAYKVFSADQAGPDRAVARYVAELPAGARIATTYWPAERLLNFLDARRVTVLTPGTAAGADYDVLIDSDRAEVAAGPGDDSGRRFGHYVVYRMDEGAEQLASMRGNP